MERTEVQDVYKKPEKVSPENYLDVTKRPVTEERFYTLLKNPMTTGQQLNSIIGRPECNELMVVKFSYDQIRGDTEDIDVEKPSTSFSV